MDTRKHRRVRMRLPVRLRWTTPFGQRIELGETMDVSRSGLLVATHESHAWGVSLWVTFPYDASLPDSQPEMSARVTRCEEMLEPIRVTTAREKFQTKKALEQKWPGKIDQVAVADSDAPAAFAVAVHFELQAQAHDGSNGDAHRGEFERRRNPRRALTVPVRVRPEKIPWFEEAMTIDYSITSVRFRSSREYRPGDRLRIAFYGSASAPWRGAGEFLSEVVRVAPVPGSIALDVSVCRVK